MRSLAATAVAVCAVVGAACGEGSGNPAEAYCGQIQLHLDELETPSIDSALDIQETLTMYRTITDAAPIGIQPEWEQLLTSIETASTVDTEDPESLQRVADTARASRGAATRVQQYTVQVCDLRIAEPPPITNPVTATTEPPETTGSTGSTTTTTG